MSHAPDKLWIVLDQENKFISVGSTKMELLHFLKDNPNKGWRVVRAQNNNYWSLFSDSTSENSWVIKNAPEYIKSVNGSWEEL